MAEETGDLHLRALERAQGLLRLARSDLAAAEGQFQRLSFEAQKEIVFSARGEERRELILLARDATPLVQALPSLDLFLTLKGLGGDFSIALLESASAEQIADILDLDCWHRDRLSLAKVLEWFELLLECGEEKVLEILRELDKDLLVSVLKRFTRLDETKAEKIDFGGWEVSAADLRLYGRYFVSPDKISCSNPIIHRFIWLLYDLGWDFYIEMMELVLKGPDHVVIDDARAARTDRLKIKGFPSYEEARAIYEPKKPPKPQAEEARDAQAQVAGYITQTIDVYRGDSFLARVLKSASGHLATHQLDRIQREIVDLANKVLVADEVDLSHPEEVSSSLSKARDFINIGLEVMAGGDRLLGEEILKKEPIIRTFEAGHKALKVLKRRASRLYFDRRLAKVEKTVSIFEPRHQNILQGLTRSFPLYFSSRGDRAALATPLDYRQFQDLKEVKEVEEALKEMEFAVRYFWEILPKSLQKPPRTMEEFFDQPFSRLHPSDPEEVNFAMLGALLAANIILNNGVSIAPIPFDRIKELCGVVKVEGGLPRAGEARGKRDAALPTERTEISQRPASIKEDVGREVISALVPALSTLGQEERDLARRFFERSLDLLAVSLAEVAPEMHPAQKRTGRLEYWRLEALILRKP